MFPGRQSMSKELVISANRHETRVAIIEDDQVVEVYHQRENEYSLAGSIHKGKVTRVLPGMQSAFVDIGLERDAFLYVSDFFEDNEEYDKIVTSVEEKVLKLDRSQTAAVAVAGQTPVVAEPGASPEAAPEPAIVEGTAPAAATPVNGPAVEYRHDDRRGGRDDRRGGRRSRRRRGQKGGGGRGLPESKFYPPGTRLAPGTAVAESPAPLAEPELPEARKELPDDFLMLPGESLAKYTQPEE